MIIGAIMIMAMGMMFSLLGLVIMNTGRASTYDRAARKMAKASDTSKADKKAAKEARKAAKAAEED